MAGMHTKGSTTQFDIGAIRAVAVDLDGTTLLPDFTMGDRTVRVLRAYLDRGIPVIISTGRSPVSAEPFRAAIGTTGPMVFYNGAVVIDAPSATVLAGTLLAGDIAAACAQLGREMDVYFHTFLPGDRLVCDGERREAKIYEERTQVRAERADLHALFRSGGPQEAGCIKGMFMAEEGKLDLVEKELDRRFGGRVYRARSYSTFLEVMAAGVSKGHALKLALKLRGIDPAATLAIGDGENDLPMLAAVGFSAAPANAAEDVRRAAQVVIGSSADEGPARFLEDLLK